MDSTDFLEEMRKHLKVVVVNEMKDLPRKSCSPFATHHTGDTFYIHASELSGFHVLVHEFGHLVAWLVAGKPEGDNFGCRGLMLVAEDLEYHACCIEIELRRRKGEPYEELKEVMLNDFSYASHPLVLDAEVEEGENREDKFMHDSFEQARWLLGQYKEKHYEGA